VSAGFATLQRFLRETSGFALEDDKRYLLEDRLQPVLRAAKIGSLDDLARCLQNNTRSELAQSVIEALTINETSFFRDRSLFTVFTERLLPELQRARLEERRLRIWCAACSTGQEPYSLAMLIDEHMRALSGWQVEIIATDLSRPVIETAKRGIYSQFEVQRGLPVAMLLRNFRREKEYWQISDYLRARVSFRTHNLLSAPRDLGRFDMIFCRNVLLYFDIAMKRRVLDNMSSVLADDGFLALGAAETVAGLSESFLPSATHFVFKKENAAIRDAHRASA
jgi:chemotaxis protein methyltransferase CheR